MGFMLNSTFSCLGCSSFIEKSILPLLNWFYTFIKNQSSIFMWVYFWLSILFHHSMCLCLCWRHNNLIPVAMQYYFFLIKCIWHIKLCKFKVYNILVNSIHSHIIMIAILAIISNSITLHNYPLFYIVGMIKF